MREGRKVSQRIVRHIGVAEIKVELTALKELGEIINVGIQCERQSSRVPQKKLADLANEARRNETKKGPPVVIEEFHEGRRVVTGFYQAYGAVYRS